MHQIHEYAEIFPFISESQVAELAARIKANGQREPIVLLDGAILDGRCRLAACNLLHIEPKFRDFGSRDEDGDDPLEFVIDLNLHRRHLEDGARALAAARYATAKVGNPNFQSYQLEKIGTREAASEKFGISAQAIDRAKVVLTHGTPELQSALAEDVISVSDAAKVAHEPEEVQRRAVSDVKEGKTRSAAASVNRQFSKPRRESEVSIDDRMTKATLSDLRNALAKRAEKIPHEAYAECLGALESLQRAFDRWVSTTCLGEGQ